MPANPIRYTVSCRETSTHHIDVKIHVPVKGPGPVRLAMPVWTPGSYSVEDFAGRVHGGNYSDETGKTLIGRKIDKSTWQVSPGNARTVIVRYKVFALDVDVHRSYFDDTRCTINGASVFMYVVGRQAEPVQVTFEPAPGWTRISTGLEPRGRSGREFSAASYDDLIDCPVMLGRHRVETFHVRGIPHRVAIGDEGNCDVPQLLRDTERIVTAGIELFDEVPYEHYTFLLETVPEGYGGLEHKNSTHMILGRWSFQPRSQYILALGLIAHEYFHTWNVKRLRPAPLGPFDYSREAYTDALWFAEGFTSYYDLVLQVRAGVLSPREYLEEMAREVRRLWMAPGRSEMTLAESSFDTWIKLYKPTADSPNTTISYYNKGCLYALALDLEIRNTTKNARSLDDVMRLLYRRYVRDEDRGLTSDEILAAASEVAGRSLKRLHDLIVHDTREVDWNAYLAHAGLEIESKQRPRDPKTLEAGEPRTRSFLGLRLRSEAGTFVTQALASGPARAAGISPGDELIAMNGLRLDEGRLEKWLGQHAPGTRVTFTIARAGLLRTLEVPLGERPLLDFAIQPRARATALEKKICRDWTTSDWAKLDRPERGFDFRPKEKMI